MKKLIYRPILIVIDFIKSIFLIFNKDNKSKFSTIYKLNYWNSSKGSKSGVGSNINSTKNIRKELRIFLKKKKIKTFLDIPCGDFYWMKKINLKELTYIGGDIVEDLINYNKANYGKKNIKFILKDLVNDKFQKYDVIFVRDCFVHLSDKDIISSLINICKSKSVYLISTYFKKNWDNSKSKKLDNWRPINLMEKPFSLPVPDYVLNDKAQHNKHDKHKVMGVWKIKKLKLMIKKRKKSNVSSI